MKTFCFFLVLLLSSIRLFAYADPLQKANTFFEATLFEQAIPHYEQALKSWNGNENEKAETIYQLAQCYLLTEKIDKIPEITTNLTPPNGKTSLLLGIAYNKLNLPDKAISTLTQYLNDKTLTYEENLQARYEIGLAYYHLKKWSEAKKYLQELSELPPQKTLILHARLILGQIALKQGFIGEAEKILKLSTTDSHVHPLTPYSTYFLKGAIAAHEKQWKKAAQFYRLATPENHNHSAPWVEEALFYEGQSLLQLAKMTRDKNFVTEAEERFVELLKKNPSDSAYLALGECYLINTEFFADKTALEKLNTLTSTQGTFLSREALHQALLLKAESSSSYEEKKKIYRQLTHQTNSQSSIYGKAWYLRGVNEFEQAQNGKDQRKHLDESIVSLEKAFHILKLQDPHLAAEAVISLTQVHFAYDEKKSYEKGLTLLAEMLSIYRDDLFIPLNNPAEIYCLQGFGSSQLFIHKNKDSYFSQAEKSLKHTIESYPDSPFYEPSLKLLGMIYYNKGNYSLAEKIFYTLAEETTSPEVAAEALFWRANSLDHEDPSLQKSRHVRQMIIQKNPGSTYAAEAYFRLYPYSDYLMGKKEALEHLKKLDTLFPSSPYRIHAYYLLGYHYKNKKTGALDKAVDAFCKVEETYQLLNLSPESNNDLTLVKYRAMTDRAHCLLTLAEESVSSEKDQTLSEAHNTLLLVTDGLKLTPLGQSQWGSMIKEEANYTLSQCLSLLGDHKKAQTLLAEMLNSYRTAKITRGYHLSKTCTALAQLDFNRGDSKSALDHFRQAEDAAKGKVLSTDELLELWISQSLCHQSLGELDEAMLLLSKVINHNVVSGVRIKAMYLRADIYQEQGRHELARKQLEATSKKGGSWAQKAKQQLEDIYAQQ